MVRPISRGASEHLGAKRISSRFPCRHSPTADESENGRPRADWASPIRLPVDAAQHQGRFLLLTVKTPPARGRADFHARFWEAGRLPGEQACADLTYHGGPVFIYRLRIRSRRLEGIGPGFAVRIFWPDAIFEGAPGGGADRPSSAMYSGNRRSSRVM